MCALVFCRSSSVAPQHLHVTLTTGECHTGVASRFNTQSSTMLLHLWLPSLLWRCTTLSKGHLWTTLMTFCRTISSNGLQPLQQCKLQLLFNAEELGDHKAHTTLSHAATHGRQDKPHGQCFLMGTFSSAFCLAIFEWSYPPQQTLSPWTNLLS